MTVSDRSDHDILIGVETTLKTVVKQLEKLNDKTATNQTNIGCLQGCFKTTDVRIKNLEKRPSAFKAVLAVGGVLAGLLTLFELVKL